ncbi:glycosyltransferase [Streptomyces silvisoli]|uniref:Glycosyltransferase n=1 Tax=Streptomyces silvisoli TaxID=3034235 RepID=A0ABT5ZUG9_9ACTN|nr:glycosyltransferase [Streptomyces silvisoli]MDF3293381.1 glycosyltransferase [Streptomyces silvisoli]
MAHTLKTLFVAAGSPATVFALAPLATAARNAGHEVFVAATEDMMPVVVGAGLPGVAVTGKTMRDYMFATRDGVPLVLPTDTTTRLHFGGHGFGRLAADSMAALRALGRAWRPDIVIGGTLSFAAGLLAAELGVPYVRHAWDMGEPVEMDLGAEEELAPELARLGLERLPEPRLWIHICPPRMLTPDAAVGAVMRFVPTGRQRQLEPWMYTAGDRPRICVTAGSRVSRDQDLDFLEGLVAEVGRLDVELVIAAPEEAAAALTRPQVRAGWLPLGTVLRTCDALVHSGGGQTALTAMQAGVPQLVVPNMPKLVSHSRRLSEFGAAITLLPGQDTCEAITAACHQLVSEPSYTQRSRELAADIAALPDPAEVLSLVEQLAVG